MNQQVKQLWIDALRSGKYTKGTRRLKKKNIENGSITYCCLGVLCEVALEKGILKPSHVVQNDDDAAMGEEGYKSYMFAEEAGVLPDVVANWAGISENPSIQYASRQYNITTINDEHNTSFEDIANLIEKHL